MDLINELNKMGLTQSDYEECLSLIVDKKYNDIDIDWQEIRDKYNIPLNVDTLRKASNTIFGGAFVSNYLNSEKSCSFVNADTSPVLQSSININKDGSQSSNKLLMMTEEESKNPEFILKAHGFNPDSWKLVSARNTIRQAISKDEGTQTLYASYITVKPLDEKEISLERYGEFFDNLDRKYSLPELNKTKSYLDGDKMLLIDIADLHLNLQASILTTGNEYNCDIAEILFFYVINDILSRTNHYSFKEIIFCIGGDMLNADNLQGTTTKGTPQNNDIHYYDAYERLCAMTIKAIDLLKDICKVKVIYVMGNHDEVSGFKLAKYIDAWFRTEDMVEVDYLPRARKYQVFGKTLLCFAHDGNVKTLPSIIADEAREYWSFIDTTEVFLQHLHSEQLLFEDNNIRIQRLPTISAKSKWANDKGYNSKRQCKSFIFDINDGLTDVLYTPIKNK